MTDGDPSMSDDPGRIRSIAVHRDDVATALEATLRSDREVVLRVTPPFSGRMRARLHSLGASDEAAPDDGGEAAPAPVHVDPRDLVSDVPPYPEVDETMADNPDADLETRRKRHTEAVESWREAVRESVAAGVELDADGSGGEGGETVEVDVTALG
ncbi:hypothetical protein C471_01352 [Halorubrum saccharovorum DSM 1137]|uniref:DUF8009 domain-containing protein n=1 Tax=Halorubrum saccharovorum DSM 1137 TaxID=1227484 RepID=M0EA44_9EURY|nr:hypothetical protein [Halorubrum saccharovorum]ELZ43284.1 hypothetical protein C471_01352 [Halorubrum saccharovorum DSM 1137]